MDADIEVQIVAAEFLGKEGAETLHNRLQSEIHIDTDTKIKMIDIFINNNFFSSINTLKNEFLNLVKYKETQNIKYLELCENILKAFRNFKSNKLNHFFTVDFILQNPLLEKKIIKTLGACGSKIELELLYSLNKTNKKQSTRKEINNAITEIQSRLTTGEKGWLSVEDLSNNDKNHLI